VAVEVVDKMVLVLELVLEALVDSAQVHIQ
jgi:hypothetical protein